MSLKSEIEVFDHVRISTETGETDVWDRVIFPNCIRNRETSMILKIVSRLKPDRILDFGCGTGWVSKALLENGYKVTGIDTSSQLIRSASQSMSGETQFIAGDCMHLPFRNGSFDLVIGIAILHHLSPTPGLAECYRVTSSGGTLLLMEPNKYNPVAALGRKLAPIDTQTPDEEPFTPGGLKTLIQSSAWNLQSIKYLFPYSFLLSRIVRKIHVDKRFLQQFCFPIIVIEKLIENIPILNRLCWVIVVEVNKSLK